MKHKRAHHDHAAGRHVRWAVIDRALAEFTPGSVVAVLAAAMDAPSSTPWEYHLSLLWLRALRRPPRGSTAATGESLAALVAAAIRAAPAHEVVSSRWPNDPRQEVGFTIGGRRWRIHPGDYEHPLMLLRRIATAARAVDSEVLRVFGFTLTDLMEVILAHGHRTITRLSPLWPTTDLNDHAGQAAPTVADAEVAAVAALHTEPADELTSLCQQSERAAAALAWLTSRADRVTVHHTPPAPVFGAVLVVVADDRPVGIPACLTLGALIAATEAILGRVGQRSDAADRLQAATTAHAAAVFSKKIVDRSANLSVDGVVVSPRTVMALVSALAHRGLVNAIALAHSELDAYHDDQAGRGPYARTNPVNVILFGGPMVVGFQTVQDVVLLHIEELVELLDDAEGDWITVECFLEDLGRHAGYEGVMFLDVLDVWAAWRKWGRLGPAEVGGHGAVLQVTPHERDLTWDRAAAWEPIDAVLAAARLPEHVDWPIARLVPEVGGDLFATAADALGLVSVEPPVVILLDPSDGDALGLDVETLFGLADGLRTCLAGHQDVADHFRLANRTPLTIVVRLLDQPEPLPVDEYAIRVATDTERGLIEIGVSTDVLEQFLGDGMAGHDIVGLALHEAVRQVRLERGEGPGTEVESFRQAWHSVGPVSTFVAHESVPHVAPVDTMPRSAALRARALYSVFDLVRQTGVTGTFVNTEAHEVCRDHLIPAIEQALYDRLCASEAGVLPSLSV